MVSRTASESVSLFPLDLLGGPDLFVGKLKGAIGLFNRLQLVSGFLKILVQSLHRLDPPSNDAFTSATIEMPPGVNDYRNANQDQDKTDSLSWSHRNPTSLSVWRLAQPDHDPQVLRSLFLPESGYGIPQSSLSRDYDLLQMLSRFGPRPVSFLSSLTASGSISVGFAMCDLAQSLRRDVLSAQSNAKLSRRF
jgi:hypothetical protein